MLKMTSIMCLSPGYVFPVGLKALMWTGLSLIKIKKKKGDRMDSVGFKPMTIICN